MVATLSLTLLLFHLSNAQSQKTTIWTETLTYNVDSTACQCQKWLDFWQFWIGDPSQVVSITLGGSLTSTTYKCSGSAAQFIAFALASPPYESTQVTCESGIWYTGHADSLVYGTFGQAAVGVNTLTTVCSSDPAIRPCWSYKGWGGIGSVTCMPPTQTLKVTVVSNIPTATVPPASVTWTDSFVYNSPATSAQCNNWKQFWQNTVPRSGSLSVTLVSSINGGLNATCSGAGVRLLATALFTATSNGQYHCSSGTVWYFNDIYPAYPNTSALSAGSTPSSCSATWALKPCWDQPLTANWGGFGNVTCAAASQTFTATVAIGTNTITNVCWKQVNVAITTGTFTVSCNTIMLQCNTTFTASGYGTSLIGTYYCTSGGVWCPAVPSCIVVSTATTTTTTTTSTTICNPTTTSSTTSSSTSTSPTTSTSAVPTTTTTSSTTTSSTGSLSSPSSTTTTLSTFSTTTSRPTTTTTVPQTTTSSTTSTSTVGSSTSQSSTTTNPSTSSTTTPRPTTTSSTTKSTTSSTTSPTTSSSTTSTSTVRPTTTVSSTVTTSTSSSTSKSPTTTTPTTSSTTPSVTSTSTISSTTTLSSTSDISGSATYDSASISSLGSGTINTSPSGSTQQPLKVKTTPIGHGGLVWFLAAPLVAAVMVIGGFCTFLICGTKMKLNKSNGATQTSADF